MSVLGRWLPPVVSLCGHVHRGGIAHNNHLSKKGADNVVLVTISKTKGRTFSNLDYAIVHYDVLLDGPSQCS